MSVVDCSSHSPVSYVSSGIVPNVHGQSVNTRRSSALSTTSYESIKRFVDIIGAIFLCILFSPVMLIAAVAIYFSSPGGIIFKQERLTVGGRRFTIYKFRTMVKDAEQKTGAVWAGSRDPRVTYIGSFLRRARIDELPQLINVLRGEMSLIGPRPERPEIAEELALRFPNFHQRLEVKAGISGLAQVGSGYASCLRSYKKKLAFDLIYIRNRCLLLDLRIALKTIVVMLTGAGAR